jgi:type II secretory pathway pseudopilin PulG
MRRAGFTLVEVLMAMGIVIFAVSLIADLQFRSLIRMTRDRDDIEKVYLVKQELFKHMLEPQKEKKKYTAALENPEIKFSTQVDPINPKSALADLKENLLLVRTEGLWKHDNVKRSTSILALVFKPIPKKDEKKK